MKNIFARLLFVVSCFGASGMVHAGDDAHSPVRIVYYREGKDPVVRGEPQDLQKPSKGLTRVIGFSPISSPPPSPMSLVSPVSRSSSAFSESPLLGFSPDQNQIALLAKQRVYLHSKNNGLRERAAQSLPVSLSKSSGLSQTKLRRSPGCENLPAQEDNQLELVFLFNLSDD